eukprot:TRINITY_DN4454_c0_g2_i4.p1 TRINITY_DN4454_c0_g2~~TRINITY_DN4454_c0_g2_i4.p1  ORF type:complete len:271 (-),score=32.99 TRINITY_DN4454_c0_g2_i4:338-1150(-)
MITIQPWSRPQSHKRSFRTVTDGKEVLAYREETNSLDFAVFGTQPIKGGIMGQRMNCRSNLVTPGPGYYSIKPSGEKKSAVFGYSSRDLLANARALSSNSYIDIYSPNDPIRPKSASFSFSRAELKRSKGRSSDIPAPGYYYVSKYKDKNVSGPVYKRASVRSFSSKNSRDVAFTELKPFINSKRERNNFQKFSSLERSISKNSKFYQHKMMFKSRKSLSKCKKVLENTKTAWKIGRKEKVDKLCENAQRVNHLMSSAKNARKRRFYSNC